MRISGKYLLGSSIQYEFSETPITFVANQERFVAMKNIYEYDDETSTSTYTLSFIKEDSTELIIGARVGSTTNWYVDENYLLVDVGEEQFVEGGIASLLSGATHQTIYLKAGTYQYNDELIAGGLSVTTAPEKQYFDFNAEISAGNEKLKVKQIAIGYHYSSNYYYSYLGYIGDGYTNDELTHENFELAIFNSEEEGAQGQWVTNIGIDPKSIVLPATTEVTVACEKWFSANTNYKKLVKVPISGCYSGEKLLDLPDCEEMVNCKFNFGLRRRDGEGLRVNSEGIYLYRDGEWKPFILMSDDDLELLEYQGVEEAGAINFGESQEVSLGFFEALTGVASPAPWSVVCPTCLKNRKWKKVLKPSTIYHTFYNPVDYTTKVFVKFNVNNSGSPSTGVILLILTLDENGTTTKMEIPYADSYGGWLSGFEINIENGETIDNVDPNNLFLIDPPEYDLEGWESDICSTVLLWEDTETTEQKYELGKRKFKQTTTTLRLDHDFADGAEKYSWLYENRFEISELSVVDQYGSQLMLSIGPFSPLVEQKNGRLSFALGYFIKILLSIEQSIGVMAFFDFIEELEVPPEDLMGEEGLFSTFPAQEFTLTAYSEATRDWLLENTDPVEEKTIPKGTYVILHKAPEVWRQKMLDTYGEEKFSSTSYFQKIDFTTSIGSKKVLCDEIQLNNEISSNVPKTSLDYRTKGVGLEEIRSTTDTGYWYDDKSRKITLTKDALVGKMFFDWFVEATDYKLVTGQDSVLGWREFNDTYVPLYDGSSWTTEYIVKRYNTYGATISTQKESEFTTDGHTLLSSNEVTPPFYYSSSTNKAVSLGYVQDATSGMQQLGHLDPLRNGKIHNLLAVENQVAAAWFYEHTTPVAEKIIPQGRYLFKSEITKPEGWDTMENGWEMPIEFSLQFNNNNVEITKIRINADSDSLDLYVPAFDNETDDGWEETYLYAEGRWYIPELSSWFVKKNTKATEAQYSWFMENTIKVSGPRKIKEDAAAIVYTFDPTVSAQRKTALNTHKIAIQPQKMEVGENVGWLFGFTPKMVYNGTDSVQYLGGIFDPPTVQDQLIIAASEAYKVPTYVDIIDVASLEIAQWVATNTEEADEVAGCWKWTDMDKITPPKEAIEQDVKFEAWSKGTRYYRGDHIKWSTTSNNGSDWAYIRTLSNEEDWPCHWDAYSWWDNSGNQSARVFNFGKGTQVVKKEFGDFLRNFANPEKWGEYHFEVTGRWVWDEKPKNIPIAAMVDHLPIINGKQYDALFFGKQAGTSYIFALEELGEDEEFDAKLITLYCSEIGWQETPFFFSGGLDFSTVPPEVKYTALLTDKWKEIDLNDQTAHLNANQYRLLRENARDMSDKEFERFDKTEEFVSAVNNKSFQKLN